MRLEDLTATDGTQGNTRSHDETSDETTAVDTYGDETIRPSDAGWTSYADDPWTTARDMAHKHVQDVAKEGYAFNTSAYVGWVFELSQSGFGPTALLPLGTARNDWAGFEGDVEAVEAENVALIRSEAGFRPNDSSAYRVRQHGPYRDYIQAAGISVADPELDAVVEPLFTEGVQDDDVWERILADEGLAPIV